MIRRVKLQNKLHTCFPHSSPSPLLSSPPAAALMSATLMREQAHSAHSHYDSITNSAAYLKDEGAKVRVAQVAHADRQERQHLSVHASEAVLASLRCCVSPACVRVQHAWRCRREFRLLLCECVCVPTECVFVVGS